MATAALPAGNPLSAVHLEYIRLVSTLKFVNVANTLCGGEVVQM